MSGYGRGAKWELKVSTPSFNFREFELLERLAELEHEQWAHWMNYMFANRTPENIARWKKQAKTSYFELSEKEKESDREWARKVLQILSLYGWKLK
jgi:hypothetical protein